MKILGIIDRRRKIRESDGPISVRRSQHSAKHVRDGRFCPEFWSLDPWMLFPAVLLVGPVRYVDHNNDESGRQ